MAWPGTSEANKSEKIVKVLKWAYIKTRKREERIYA